ncbi:MAG: branched-chain amino acid ABC transporter permease [Campylobacter sp.]|nr:branched-chain amino acid ABC transporter permease [Campylobacter sp.]
MSNYLKTKILHFIFLLSAVVFIYLSNFIFDEYSLSIVNNIAIFIILAASYNLINGVTGQFSLEPNGFVAVGAYIAALLLLSPDAKSAQFYIQDPNAIVLAFYSSNFFLAMFLAGLGAALLALILSFPVFRVRGDYLAIVTLGFGFIIQICAINAPSWTNGSLGLNEIPLHSNIYYTGGAAVITIIAILNLIYSKFGRAMKAVRDDEDAAHAMGINTFKIKTLAFCTSAFFEGIGGALLVCLLGSVSPDQFTFFFTFQLLIIIVLGGLGSTTGAIIGTVLVMGGSEWLRFLDEPMEIFGYQTPALPGFRMVVFSVVLILVMLFAREGIMGKKELLDIKFKKWFRK